MSSPDAEQVVIALTTVGTEADAERIARTLVTERLAACVNVLPGMQSVYRWQGDVSTDREHQLVIKTTNARLEALRAKLSELHPYELPEFLVMPALDGSAAYLGWVVENTRV